MSDNTKDTTKDNDETPLFVPPDDIDTDNFFDDVELDEETVTCSSCGNKFKMSDMASNIFIYDQKTGFCMCNKCHDEIAIQNYKDTMSRGENVYTTPGDPLQELKRKALHSSRHDELIENITSVIESNTPETFKEHLDKYVIGQEEAKKMISVAVYNHYKRVIYFEQIKAMREAGKKIPDALPDELAKSNVLIAGPSGCGKTLLLQTIAKVLDVPFTIVDASTLTEAGFVGADVETSVRQLYQVAGGDIDRTQHGIIFLDEFDKLARKSGANNMITADPGREGVQQALLKMVEGGVVSFNPGTQRRNPDAPVIQVDTTNILFVAGGAFEGLVNIIKNRVDNTGNIGFSFDGSVTVKKQKKETVDDECTIYNRYIGKATPEDFVQFGIIPELLGRLPVICTLNQLDKNMLLKILKEPKNAFVKQYKMLFNLTEHARLVFEDSALEAIADLVIKQKTGARGLRTVLEKHLNYAMFVVPGMYRKEGPAKQVVVTITKECITKDKNPEISIADRKTAA